MVLTSTPVRAAVPAGSEEAVRRALTLLAAVGEEYREGVQDRSVVRPIEFEEAKAFLQDAQQRVAGIFESTAGGENDLTPLFAEVTRALDEKVPAEIITEKLATLRQRVVVLTGVSEQVYPPAAPSAVRGKDLFDQYCATCHGERGDGRGPSASALNPPPANFTDSQFMRGETPYDFYHVISLGKRNTAMPAWDEVLSVQDRWDLVSHLWTLAAGNSAVAEGQGVYLTHCANCHGATGDGNGAFSASLMKPAPNLAHPASLARRTDADLFAATTDGAAGSPMPSFGRTLQDDERWKAVAFLRLLSLGGPATPSQGPPADGSGELKRFSGLLRLLGRSYSQAWAGGQLTDARAYNEALALLGQVSEQSNALAQRIEPNAPDVAVEIRTNLATIVLRVKAHEPATAVTAATEALLNVFSTSVSPSEAARASADQPLPDRSAVDNALAESATLIDAALAAYQRGEAQAPSMASDAYLQFEPLEQRLGATAPGLKASVEERFLHLRQLLRTAGNDAAVRDVATAIRDDYAAVRTALQPHSTPYALFVESAAIILREGFEVVLVIGALIAYVVKAGNPAMRRSVHIGTAVGIAASLATAFLINALLGNRPGSSDVLEGITMLLAAVVLFWVSYWLISKAEADKWQRYIRGKVQTALSGGRAVALASAAFLAVYREGFETVLFYQALYASAPTASLTITAGFAVGAVVLLVVYGLFRRFEVQIPIRQFFFVTGLFLYAMAAIFAGQGIHELQEAGWIAMSPVAGVPAIPLLGIHPSAQSLAVQALFVGLLLYATAVTLRRSRRAAARQRDADAVGELRAVRETLDALRHEIERARLSAVATPSGDVAAPLTTLGDRLEGALHRIEELAGQVHLQTPGNGHGNGRKSH